MDEADVQAILAFDETMIGSDGILKKLVNCVLDAEMNTHLGHGRPQLVINLAGSTHNVFSRKKLKGELGELPIDILRDRHGSFGL